MKITNKDMIHTMDDYHETNRLLGGEDYCKTDRMFNTTYNTETKVPPYVGIMFEISSFTDIEINTFEVDIRWDLKPADLSVQVYTLEGQYADRFNMSSAWELVASSTIVQAPEGNSGIIPAADFTSVHIRALEIRSFYITMTGPYIDHTVYGLQKTGDIHTKGDDFQLFVGSGFTADNFPGEIDKVLDPQFAGIIYYKKAFQCDDNTAQSTRITFQFLLQAKGINDEFVLRYNAAVDAAVDSIIETDVSLNGYRIDFGLHKNSGATTVKESYSGECPGDWSDCNSIILRSEIRLSHMNALDSSKVKIDMYRSETTSAIIDFLTSTLEGDRKIVNIGIEGVSAPCQVVLHGVSTVKLIDDVQIRYFEDTTQMFLDKFSDEMAVFRVDVVDQIEKRNRHLRNLPDGESGGSIEFDLLVNGAHPVGMTSSDYTKVISKAFQKHKDVYLSLLKNNGFRPGEISEGNRIEYFQDIESISSTVDIIEAPQQSSSDDRSLAKGLTVGILIILVVVATTVFILRHVKKQRKKIEDDEKYREQRREERRQRRLERSNQDLDSSNGSMDISTESRLKASKSSTAKSNSSHNHKKETRGRIQRGDSASSISISIETFDRSMSESPRISRKSDNKSDKDSAVFAKLRRFFGIQRNEADVEASHFKNAKYQSSTVDRKSNSSSSLKTKNKAETNKTNVLLPARSKSLSPITITRKTLNASQLKETYMERMHHSFDSNMVGVSGLDCDVNRINNPRLKNELTKTVNTRTEIRSIATLHPSHASKSSTTFSRTKTSAKKSNNVLRQVPARPGLTRKDSNRSLDMNVLTVNENLCSARLPCGQENPTSRSGVTKTNSSRSISPTRNKEQRCARPHPNAIRIPVPVVGSPDFHRSLDLQLNRSLDLAVDVPKQVGGAGLHRSLDLSHIDMSDSNRVNDSKTNQAIQQQQHRSSRHKN